MKIADEQEYGLTQAKLEGVRATIARIESEAQAGSPSARAVSLRSLRAYANQLIEELTRYETEHGREPAMLTRSSARGAR